MKRKEGTFLINLSIYRKECTVLQIKISDEALDWFKNEVTLGDTSQIKFQAKYGGSSEIHQGFSLALEVNGAMEDPVTSVDKDGITFFIDDYDAWYFDGYNLIVNYDENLQEVSYQYEKIE